MKEILVTILCFTLLGTFIQCSDEGTLVCKCGFTGISAEECEKKLNGIPWKTTCCNDCIKYVDKDGDCTYGREVYPHPVCRDGLYCIRNICTAL